MEFSPLPGHAHFYPQLNHAIRAEQQISRIIPHLVQAVWSGQLSRTLQQALSMSEQHQLRLAEFCIMPGETENAPADLESRIMHSLHSQQRGSIKDLSLTLLFAKAVQHKISCYEGVLDLDDQGSLTDLKNVVGEALSDDLATDLFLQEQAERFVAREYAHGATA
ncbi:DUF892 family protein [Dyadobacter sp. CY323]|uniref:DUF892 family protein n=1 Tax=Dyadobacter sp. CY323 TaxID=2907302 RepID=UPI001F39A9B8|nr:DUF892 family protein [Dyadobacter sp. CY323]MCE6992956.1 DUF892 family protein [Dyadobacter sp. CY323]